MAQPADAGWLTAMYQTVDSLMSLLHCVLHLYSAVCTDLAYYKRAVAFVMAYSFAERMKDIDSESSWDSADEHKGPPIMVPMADILNHVANNNARLNFGVESLKMVATRPIDEVSYLTSD